MANKKNFRTGADKFISAFDEQRPQGTPGTQGTQQTQTPQHYRFNLKLRPQYREYLELAAWKAHKSITEYMNDLIETDKQRKERE